MAEKNTDSIEKLRNLLNEVADKSAIIFGSVDRNEQPTTTRIGAITQEYIEYFNMDDCAISESQLSDIKKYLNNLLESFERISKSGKAVQSFELTRIHYYLDKLFFYINFEKNYHQTLYSALSDQHETAIKKIEESSGKLDLQVQNAKKVNELLQSQYEKTSSDLQASNLEQLQKIQEQSNNLKTLIEEQAKTEIDNFNSLVGKANELHNFMQGRALSDFFAKRAIEEKTSAQNWTMATWGFASVTLLAIIAIFIYQVLYFSPENKADLSLLGTKVLFTATLGLIAKWTSKRANRHLAEESKYHRLSINISTIDSFVEKLEEKARHEVLAAVAMKTFTEVSGNETATDFETASILDFIKGVIPKDGK